MTAASLRARLLTLIIAPLVLVACVIGAWRYQSALATAEDLFDRGLLSAGLAISRDVAISGGDALSPTTRDRLREAAGGAIYYHVSGPDRSYVTGYAYPPSPGFQPAEDETLYFNARHQGEPVRAVRLSYLNTAPPTRGYSTVTVWQQDAERGRFATSLALEAAATLIILVTAVAAIVWFGVAQGLRPLKDLQQAISARSTDDLSGIRRPVPREVRGVVVTLNQLFDQLREALAARDAFISDAAHQLRNPAAAILTLAEAAKDAKDDARRRERLTDLHVAAGRLGRLTNQLLSFETVKGRAAQRAFARIDLSEIARSVAEEAAPRALEAGLAFDFAADGPAWIMGDAVLIREALANLIDNSLRHGPPKLSRVEIVVEAAGPHRHLIVRDDGAGLSPADEDQAFARFGQVGANPGSGLGLAIALRVAELHEAKMRVDPVPAGASVRLTFTGA